uniref:Uncharacterized protein n=1 Tax=Neobodo designis TaxID=312471 RepID=A0A7S1KZ40_NEODS|mmetsp:Transcript_10431/g.32343  ORF Transcript_10431/g.32343 Transcript_10431/m.32343 type:complete len:157 (+) Transcript_10431:94-564(+)
MTIMRDAEMYVLYAGLALFALNVFPVNAVRRIGGKFAHAVQLRVPLPSFEGDAKPESNQPRAPPPRKRNIALLLLVGWVFAFLTIVSFATWHRRYVDVDSPLHTAPSNDLGARWEYYFVKWRAERDLYIRATAAVAYLTLHVLVDCHEELHKVAAH